MKKVYHIPINFIIFRLIIVCEGLAVTKKKQVLVPIIILVIAIAIAVALVSMKKPPEEKPKVDVTPIVAVEEVSVAPVTLHVDSYGVVKPKYETELVAQISGQIVELSGEFVRGGFVKKGQLLARIDPSDYEAALIDAQANLASATASLEQERAEGKVRKQEWERITDASPTELSLRKPQLKQEMARVKAAEASVLRAKRNLERTEVKAPYDAMIESRNIGLGSFVGTGSNLGKLLGTAIAEVRLPIADNQLQYLINQGKKAKVKLVGTFAGKETVWQANISRSEGVVDNKSRMSYLVAEVKDPYFLNGNSDNLNPLRFGAYVNAQVLGQELSSATSVPRYLVTDGRVATLNESSELEFVDVNIARSDGKNVIITGGLVNGDQIITSALDYPINGMKLSLPSEDSETVPAVEEKTDAQIASVKD